MNPCAISIQVSSILRRDGSDTASGIHVVPDPIRSMLTPAGPIIKSSAPIPGIGFRVESACLIDASMPGITGLAGVPIESILRRFLSGFFWVFSPMGMFMGTGTVSFLCTVSRGVSCAARGFPAISKDRAPAKAKAPAIERDENIFHPKVNDYSVVGAETKVRAHSDGVTNWEHQLALALRRRRLGGRYAAERSGDLVLRSDFTRWYRSSRRGDCVGKNG